jgi:hypothetical protein
MVVTPMGGLHVADYLDGPNQGSENLTGLAGSYQSWVYLYHSIPTPNPPIKSLSSRTERRYYLFDPHSDRPLPSEWGMGQTGELGMEEGATDHSCMVSG